MSPTPCAMWDVELLHIDFDDASVPTGHLSSGDAGAGFSVDNAFEPGGAIWGGRPSSDAPPWLGVELKVPARPELIVLRQGPGRHRVDEVSLQSSADGASWTTVAQVELPHDSRQSVVMHHPDPVPDPSQVRIVADRPRQGFAWDVESIVALGGDEIIAGTWLESGSAGDGFSIANTAHGATGFWGGRAASDGRIHATFVPHDPDARVDRIVIVQSGDHWTPSLTIENDHGDGGWTTVRTVEGLQPGRNDVLLWTSAPPTPPTVVSPVITRPLSDRDRFGDHRILVLIASYRDPELVETVASALTQAAYPEHVRFGICHQYDHHTEHLLDRWSDDPRFAIDAVPFAESTGCCWARHRTFALYDHEPYVLQIDAHTRFAARWDVRYIDMLESIDADRPVLTTYPPRYTIDADGSITYDMTVGVQRLYVDEVRDDLSVVQRTRPVEHLDAPTPSPTLAAGQIFTRGSFVDDVPYDPDMYFDGEEISMAARAYTSGYDLYCPNENLIWHLYNHAEPKHWDDHDSQDRRTASNGRLRALLTGQGSSLGRYGLGQRRRLGQFMRRAGIDDAVRANGLDWSDRISQHVLTLDPAIIEPRDDYVKFVLVFLDGAGNEVARRDVWSPDVLSGERTVIAVDDSEMANAATCGVIPVHRSGIGEVKVYEL